MVYMCRINLRLCVAVVFILFAMNHGIQCQELYFQQEANYQIDVVLNDTDHTLTGKASLEYSNHSAERLDTLYFNLWANAFSSKTSAFAKQKLLHGSTDFYFASQSDLGGYDELDFLMDHQSLNWGYDSRHKDIAWVVLKSTLLPGETLTVDIPFKLKIPHSYSRLGHVDQSYQMTQWYPKIAVYDVSGWHAMPYLDQGEFYSNFGNYKVSITIPENYIVAATGSLTSDAERAFLDECISRSTVAMLEETSLLRVVPKSSSQLKTIQYTADRVIDFAWFADKSFHVTKGTAHLQNGKEVETWAFFTDSQADLWKNAQTYIQRAVEDFSRWIGPYPWPQFTAVESALSAGAGMEYPMATVIGYSLNDKDLDDVLAHEIAHSWWYGMVATNEREHPWMDEGMTSYFEYRYMDKYYDSGMTDFLPGILERSTSLSEEELAYQKQARCHSDQASNLHSTAYSQLNYGLCVYSKPAQSLELLAGYLGQETFDEIFQAYFETWKFKHPNPGDFKHFVAQRTNKDLSWFFDGLIGSTGQVDYAFKGITSDHVLIENREEIAAPFLLSGFRDGRVIFEQWFDGFTGIQEIPIDANSVSYVEIDSKHVLPEVRRSNNRIRTEGIFKKIEPFSLGAIWSLETPAKTKWRMTPVLGLNRNDGFMAGVALQTPLIPDQKLELSVVPLFGFASSNVSGFGDVHYNFFPKNKLKKIQLGISSKQFTFDHNSEFDYRIRYQKWAPYARLYFLDKPTKLSKSWLDAHYSFIQEENALFEVRNGMTVFEEIENTNRSVAQIDFHRKRDHALYPSSLETRLIYHEFNSGFEDEQTLKLTLEYQKELTYANERSFEFRLFGGYFLYHSARKAGRILPGALALFSEGTDDYDYTHFFHDRLANTGLASRMIDLEQGGMKLAFGSAYRSVLGRSNSFSWSVNFLADLPEPFPAWLPIRPYLDLGYFENAQPIGINDEFSDQFLASGGLVIQADYLPIYVYFPLFHSKKIRDQYRFSNRTGLWKQAVFHVRFDFLDLFRQRDETQF